MIKKIIPAIRLLRPKEWIKNIFIFPPLIFTGLFIDLGAVYLTLAGFLIFSAASSITYVINDLTDIEPDRLHPVKSIKRPLASGELKPIHAYLVLIILLPVAASSYLINFGFLIIIIAYLGINLLYSFKLKEIPIIDLFLIAIGFVFRVYAGAVIIDVPLSGWMFVTTLTLALFLGVMKRRQELLNSRADSRSVLNLYTVPLLDKYGEIAATGSIVFYSLYVLTTNTNLVLTIPFVLFGLFRYLFVLKEDNELESPSDVLYRDWQLMLVVLLWGMACIYLSWPGDAIFAYE